MDRSLVIDMPRDKYVERCKQRAFDYLDQGDLEKAVTSFVGNMNARLDCQLPHHLATLGAVLLMANDALGWWTLIEGVSPHFIPRSFPSWTWRICRAGFVRGAIHVGSR